MFNKSTVEKSGIFQLLPWVKDRQFISQVDSVPMLLQKMIEEERNGLVVLFVSSYSPTPKSVERLGSILDDLTQSTESGVSVGVRQIRMSDVIIEEVEGWAERAKLTESLSVLVVTGDRSRQIVWRRMVVASTAMVDVSYNGFKFIRHLPEKHEALAA